MEKGEKVAALAVAIQVVLFGIKYIFSTLSGSIALKADAFHSLSDVVASSTVFIGLIIAKRKTKSFPYGLYKVENLVSVMVAIAIFYAVPLTDAHQHRISPHFGEAPYFGLITVRIKDKKAIDQKIVENPFTQVAHGKGILVAEFLSKHQIDVIITQESFE